MFSGSGNVETQCQQHPIRIIIKSFKTVYTHILTLPVNYYKAKLSTTKISFTPLQFLHTKYAKLDKTHDWLIDVIVHKLYQATI